MTKATMPGTVTLVVRMFNGIVHITRKRPIAECTLENVPRGAIEAMEKEHNATAVSWWLD